MRTFLLALVWIASVGVGVSIAGPASTVQVPITAAGAQSEPCYFDHATAGGQALACPEGGIRNVVDLECGSKVDDALKPGFQLDRNKLNCNIGSGPGRQDPTANNHVVLNPDIGVCTIIEQGYLHPYRRIASFCPRPHGPPSIKLHGRVVVYGTLKVKR